MGELAAHVPLKRRGRFAPTPSGELHLGGARTALVAWLAARSVGHPLILRVEDLDRARLVPGAETRILSDLRDLGLDWDEGPDVGGPSGPYRQSERLAALDAVVDQLLADGLAFPCFCSRAEVARAATAPHGPADEGPRYPGTCRALSSAQIAERARTRRPSVRLRVDPAQVTFTDAVHGPQREDVSVTVGDFVLRRSDQVPAYQLAVVADDIAMGVTDVVRGDDLLLSTARQLLLYRALGATSPTYAHVPLVLGPDGGRLSKRHGAIGVRPYLERTGAARLIGLLGATLGLCEAEATLMPRDLVAGFTFDRLPRAASVIDPAAW
jgi:glutamyl-tRNA synthetase